MISANCGEKQKIDYLAKKKKKKRGCMDAPNENEKIQFWHQIRAKPQCTFPDTYFSSKHVNKMAQCIVLNTADKFNKSNRGHQLKLVEPGLKQG